MAVNTFLIDDFNGSSGNLTGHSPGTGDASSWVQDSSVPGTFSVSGGGTIYGSSSASVIYYNSTAPGGTDYRNESIINFISVLGGEAIAIFINATTVFSPSGDGYFAFWTPNTWTLYKRVSGSNTSLGTYSFTPGGGQLVTAILSRSAGFITLNLDGVDRIGPIDDSSSPVSGNGYIAFYHANGTPDATSSTGIHINNVIGAPPPGVPPANSIAVTDSNPIWDPIVWVAASGQRYTTTMGSMVRTGFAGSDVGIEFDATQYGSISPKPTISYSIDGGVWTEKLLTANGVVLLGSGLTDTTHSLRLMLGRADYTQDRWTTPNNAVRIMNWRINVGKALSAPTGVLAAQTKTALFFGDSRLESVKVLSATNSSGNDGTYSIPRAIAEGLDAECGIIAYAGQGIHGAGAGNVPPGWSSTNTSAARSAGFWDATAGSMISGSPPKLPVIPDYLFGAWGANDHDYSDGTVQADVTAWCNQMRSWTSADTWIFYIIYAGDFSSAITAGVAACSDSKIVTISLPETEGVITSGTATINSVDGLHYSARGCQRVSAAIVGEVERLTGGTGSAGGSYTFAS